MRRESGRGSGRGMMRGRKRGSLSGIVIIFLCKESGFAMARAAKRVSRSVIEKKGSRMGLVALEHIG